MGSNPVLNSRHTKGALVKSLPLSAYGNNTSAIPRLGGKYYRRSHGAASRWLGGGVSGHMDWLWGRTMKEVYPHWIPLSRNLG